MAKAAGEKTEEVERGNLKLKVIEGGIPKPAGREPPSSNDSWLTGLEVGSIFLVQDKASLNYLQQQFRLLEKISKKSVVLFTIIDGKETVFPVSPIRFSNRYELVEVIGVLKQEEETTEDD